MCYYSAQGHSRQARNEEVLVVHRHPLGANWLVSPDDTSTAVCLREGTEVELLYVPDETQSRLGLPQEVKATFKMRDWWRRDVFMLANRRKILLKKLQPGQVVRIFSVPGTSDQEAVPADEKRPDPIAEVGDIRRYLSKRDRWRAQVL